MFGIDANGYEQTKKRRNSEMLMFRYRARAAVRFLKFHAQVECG